MYLHQHRALSKLPRTILSMLSHQLERNGKAGNEYLLFENTSRTDYLQAP